MRPRRPSSSRRFGGKRAAAPERTLLRLSQARRASTGATSAGRAIASSERYGFFTLPGFTSDPTLPEVIVKMLDFRSITGNFLLFFTGLTSLDYTLTVTDTVTGAVRRYESPGDYCGGCLLRRLRQLTEGTTTGLMDPDGSLIQNRFDRRRPDAYT